MQGISSLVTAMPLGEGNCHADGCSQAQRSFSYFLWTTFHISTRKAKQSIRQLCAARIFWAGREQKMGDVPTEVQARGQWPRRGWTSKRPTCQCLLWWAMKFRAAGDQQCTSIKVSKVWKCVFIPVWNKNQTFQMFPPNWFVFSLVVAIKTSAFRFRRSRFSFRTFSAYKLTPDTLKTFPWKCYYWGYFSARHFGLDEAAFSSNDNKSH